MLFAASRRTTARYPRRDAAPRVDDFDGDHRRASVRTGNLEVAQRMTAEVIEGALPDFFFRERG